MHSMFVYFGACPPIYIKLFYRSCINRFELFPVHYYRRLDFELWYRRIVV
jgi:hypothetical protein